MRRVEGEPARETRQAIFDQNIVEIKRVLNQGQIEYAVVGGMALKAHLGQTVSCQRPNGTTPDFDAIGLGPNQFEIDRIVCDLRKRAKQPGFPEVGLESCVFGEERQNGSRLQMLSSLRVDKGRYFLGYGEIEQEINPLTMATTERSINGTLFPVLPAKTTLLRYYLRGGGVVKPKDVSKLAQLRDHIQANEETEPSDSCYTEYDIFMAKVRERYPLRLGVYRAYWEFDHLTGDRISGSKGKIYSLMGIVRK